jgi:hypothetical protein
MNGAGSKPRRTSRQCDVEAPVGGWLRLSTLLRKSRVLYGSDTRRRTPSWCAGSLRVDWSWAIPVYGDARGGRHRWVSCAGLRDKRVQTVLATPRRVHNGLPFEILGLDSDSPVRWPDGPQGVKCRKQWKIIGDGNEIMDDDDGKLRTWTSVPGAAGYPIRMP